MLPHDWFAEDFTCKDCAPFFLLHGDKMKRIGLLLFLIMPGRLLPEKAVLPPIYFSHVTLWAARS